MFNCKLFCQSTYTRFESLESTMYMYVELCTCVNVSLKKKGRRWPVQLGTAEADSSAQRARHSAQHQAEGGKHSRLLPLRFIVVCL